MAPQSHGIVGRCRTVDGTRLTVAVQQAPPRSAVRDPIVLASHTRHGKSTEHVGDAEGVAERRRKLVIAVRGTKIPLRNIDGQAPCVMGPHHLLDGGPWPPRREPILGDALGIIPRAPFVEVQGNAVDLPRARAITSPLQKHTEFVESPPIVLI